MARAISLFSHFVFFNTCYNVVSKSCCGFFFTEAYRLKPLASAGETAVAKSRA